MERAKSAAILLRDTWQWKAQFYGHAKILQHDIVGNCRAEELARQDTAKPLLPGEEKVGMPMATCKLNIKNYFNKLANTHWQNAPHISHQTWPVINNKKTSELLKLSRTECGMAHMLAG